MAAKTAHPDDTAKPRGPGGRPPTAMAGRVDVRLLDAATAMFLELGFDATSCAGVAEAAGTGKATLYARYPNKAALFAAVVRRNVERTSPPPMGDTGGLDLADRLRKVGVAILRHSLQPDVLAMMRVVIATAARFPDLARHADRTGRGMAVERVAAAIGGGADRGARDFAERFVDLIFPHHQLMALMGVPSDALSAEAPARVDRALRLMGADGGLAELPPWSDPDG